MTRQYPRKVSSPRWRGASCLAVVLGLLSLGGCGDDGETCYPVRGTIVFEDGEHAKELVGGSVTFTRSSGGQIASGSIEADGSFVLSTRREGDGALAGQHRVQIEAPTPETGSGDSPKPATLKAIMDPGSAEQEVTVEPKSNSITLKVRRPAVKKK